MAPPPGHATARRAPQTGTRTQPARPRLRLVRQVGRLRPGVLGTVTVTIFFSALFSLAVLQAVRVQGQLRLDRLDRDLRERKALEAHREVQLAAAEAPDRIQAAAAEAGLVSPPEVVFLARATVQPLPRSAALSLDLDRATAGPDTEPTPVGAGQAQDAQAEAGSAGATPEVHRA